MECRDDRITVALTSFSGPSILATWPHPPGERRVTSRSGLLPLACGYGNGVGPPQIVIESLSALAMANSVGPIAYVEADHGLVR
jgi:hypothetical protein